MELRFAFLARAADVLQDGSLAAIGAGVGDFSTRTFPVVTNLAVVVNLGLSSEDRETEHLISVRFYDHSDTRLPGYDSDIRIPKLAPPLGFEATKSSYTCIFQMPGIVFQAPGRYRFHIYAADRALTDIEIHAIQAPTETTKG